MIPMLIFGIVGGLASAAAALPYGLVAAIAAYAIGGCLFALLPGLLWPPSDPRSEQDAEDAREEAARARRDKPLPKHVEP